MKYLLLSLALTGCTYQADLETYYEILNDGQRYTCQHFAYKGYCEAKLEDCVDILGAKVVRIHCVTNVVERKK